MVSFSFGPVQNELMKHTNKKGQRIIQKLMDLNESFDSALNKHDKKRTMKVMKKSLPFIKELIPHLKKHRYRVLFTNLAKEIESKIQDGSIEFADLMKFGFKHLRQSTIFCRLPYPPREKNNQTINCFKH